MLVPLICISWRSHSLEAQCLILPNSSLSLIIRSSSLTRISSIEWEISSNSEDERDSWAQQRSKAKFLSCKEKQNAISFVRWVVSQLLPWGDECCTNKKIQETERHCLVQLLWTWTGCKCQQGLESCTSGQRRTSHKLRGKEWDWLFGCKCTWK